MTTGRPRSGAGSRRGAIGFALAVGLLAAARPCAAQRPVLEIRLGGVGSIVVEGRLTSSGTLELPAAPIEELTGKALGELPFLSLPGLQAALGEQVRVEYDPRRALIEIDDPLRVLPATRGLLARREAMARARPELVYGRGFFSTITVDEDGESLLEAGWNFGRVAVNAARSSLSGDRLGIAVQPIADTWVSWQGAEQGRSLFAVRWSRGNTFAQTSWMPEDDVLRGQVGATAGAFTAFVQREPEDWNAALTYRGPVHVTVAHVRERFLARFAIGRNTSPFSLPHVR